MERTYINNKLLNYMKHKPKVYEESSSAFWNDENISKFMLEAHLNPNFEGASRNHEFIQKSVNWIDEYCNAGNGKKLLDLGCGPGIYAELLADKGFNVTGIDFSERSIKYAKQHAAEINKNIEYFYQNYLEIDYSNEFDVIILIYCDFGVLPPKDREVLLKKIHRALKTDGILILDGFTALNNFIEEETVEYQEQGFWSENPHVAIHRNYLYKDSLNTLEQHLIVTENDCECYNIWNQLYSQETLEGEIRKAGFSDTDYFDNVLGEKFTGEKATICVAAKKKSNNKEVEVCGNGMNYIISEMQPHEYPLLKDFLYEAIFQRDENNLAPKTIINDPALQVYIKDFGTQKDDYCLCAKVNKTIIGAVWVRNINGYGSIDNETPEFAISIYKDYRGYGIGTGLMKQMLQLLNDKGYEKTSLAVQKDNYAFCMYKKLGFEIIDENKEEFIMEYNLKK